MWKSSRSEKSENSKNKGGLQKPAVNRASEGMRRLLPWFRLQRSDVLGQAEKMG